MEGTDSQIQLADGRTLAYQEYGDLDGRPVFFFHGIPGSRLFRPEDEQTRNAGVRLICSDRPGFGLSTFQAGRRILDWPQDVIQLADFLEIEQFAVAGHSGGGPYAAACAFALPARVTSATIISGIGPLDAPHATDGMQSTNKMGFRVGSWLPWPLWKLSIALFYGEVRDHPETLFPDHPQDAAKADRDILKNPAVLAICRASVSEAFRQGVTGHAWEARLLSRPWEYSLQEIKIPVFIWHGEADNDTPIGMGKSYADRIPDSRPLFFPREGHLLLFNHWNEILSRVI